MLRSLAAGRAATMAASVVRQRILQSAEHNKQISLQLVRHKASTPINTVMLFVPQQEAWIVERMGKFHRILEPGLNILLPVVDRVKYVQSLKEIAIDVPKQGAITLDNVTLGIDGVLYLRILDPYLASYGVEDPEFAITQLAQTTMRSELGKMSLDKIFRERESLNVSIVEAINKASAAWGITCLRYEIRDIKLPSRVHEAMQMQVEAERRKRAAILESEGVREAEINVAEGKRQSRILASEAQRMEQINHANGEAAAMVAVAQAKAEGLNIVSESLKLQEGKNAASLFIAEEYVHAFNKLARTNNTLILPSNVGDVTSLVGQAMSIYSTVSKHNNQPPGGGAGSPAADSVSDDSHLLDALMLRQQQQQQQRRDETVTIIAGTGGAHSASARRQDSKLLANEQSSDSKFDKNA